MIPANESARRKLVALITFTYVLLIFEGAIRKWLFPSLSQYIFFIRDPFVLAAYWLAFKHGFYPRGNFFFTAGLAFGFTGLLLAGVQILSQGGSVDAMLMLAAYGWRNYFFYIPLAFVIGVAFQRPDLERLTRISLTLVVPMAVLAFLQFAAPLDSPINVGRGADATMQFRGMTVDKDHPRPMGTFTSNVGQKQFVVSCLALALALWLSPAARRFVKPWLLLPATAAILACFAVSGSRGAMLHGGIVFLSAVVCAVVIRRGGVSARALIWPAVIGVVAVTLYPILFPEGYNSFMHRWDTAAASETRYFRWGIFGRALYGFIDFIYFMDDAPLVGYGLGVAGNASTTLGLRDVTGFTGWAETDWARHIIDLGPVVGVIFIVYRIAFVTWLTAHCLSAARRNVDPLSLLLLGYVSIELLYGQITGNGSTNGFIWLFTGFCLAAAAPSAATATASRTAAAMPAPRFANLMR